MKLTRREFLKICGGSAAAIGISQLYIPEVVEALERAVAGNPPVIWLQGLSDAGCSISLLNTAHPSISKVLLKIVSLEFHQTLMASQGNQAMQIMERIAKKFKKKFIFVFEGSIPTKDNGIYATVGEKEGRSITCLEWAKELGENAKYIMAVGTCASYSGIPAGKPNPTGAKSVSEVIKDKVIVNVPGCPPHPDWILGTLLHLILYGIPELDDLGRPKLFFGKNIHLNCPNYSYFLNGEFAKKLSDEGCLYTLGCKGPYTFADCPLRHWNGGVNWCIGSKAPCIGCCQPEFPDDLAPFYHYYPLYLYYLYYKQ